MPFKSKKQMRYMFSQMPAVAKRWAKKYGAKIKKNAKRKTR
jgi:hypothetical protein